MTSIPKALFRLLAATLFIIIACGKAQEGLGVSQAGELVKLKNESLEAGISRSDGTIRTLVNLEDSVDYCNQVVDMVWPVANVPVGERIGGVTVYDELKKATYSDLGSRSQILNLKVEETAEGTVCSFEKRFEGADFTLSERLVMKKDHLRWEVKAVKLSGADRTLRIVQFVPLPMWGYECWAPIAEAPFESSPYTPFQVTFGTMDGGPVGATNWRTVIPMTVFYNSNKKNALCLVSPFEIPAVRVRFRNNIGIKEDFHWNSRNYSMPERPYFQVINEYLGLRDNRPAETGLLLTVQPAAWRPSLGWVYGQYREYFDPAPGFEPYDGAYEIDQPYSDSLTGDQFSRQFAGYYDLGVRWEEMHGHFPRYGEMIPPESVETWFCESHPRPGRTNSRARIKDHSTRAKEAGIGTFIYYNITESEWWYAKDKYPDDIARDEDGNTIPAYKGTSYPDSQACWLMCADPAGTKFGRDLSAQAGEMLRAYPDIAGFFWDVYARTYRFDFAHDDGITMVNNKPAYFPMFMYLRMMQDHVGPLLHQNGKYITCNKPTMIQALKGIDGVMARESTPAEEKPSWLIAQSYLGLNRHVMILDSSSWEHPERLFLNCLRYGYFYSRILTEINPGDSPETIRQKKRAEEIRKVYAPIIDRFKGKRWVFHPRALRLPRMTDGNIFRLEDGSVMITMVSIWRVLNNVPGTTPDLELTCRLPDAGEFKNFRLLQPDLNRTLKITPGKREGDALTFHLAEHGLASVILLEK
ncbi:MAG TPA: hypothetical protein VM123_07945 [archaeon]|nr:hypothetical protein [archaeon]